MWWMGVGGMSEWGLSWEVLSTVSCRKESRLVLGYALYTVITIVVTFAFIFRKRFYTVADARSGYHIVAVWRGFGRCRSMTYLCADITYDCFYRVHTKS